MSGLKVWAFILRKNLIKIFYAGWKAIRAGYRIIRRMIPIKEKTMVTKKIIVQNRAGIHARPSSLIVQTASKFQSNIMFEKENVTVNAKSIMGVMTMAAGYQAELTVSADGVDEAEAVAALEQLFAAKFEEE